MSFLKIFQKSDDKKIIERLQEELKNTNESWKKICEENSNLSNALDTLRGQDYSKRDICLTCRFWKRTSQEFQRGQCRINVPEGSEWLHWRSWPETLPEDWCGAYKKIKKIPEKT